MRATGVASGNGTFPAAMNRLGGIALVTVDDNHTHRAYVRHHRNGSYLQIQPPNALNTLISGLNSKGQVAGIFYGTGRALGYANRKIIGHAVDGGVGNYVGNFVSSWAQVRTADTDSKAPHAQWHKYVNKEYGLSFLYPDTYKPTVADNRCQDNYYRRYLLCLAPMGGSDPVISVTVVVAAPFHVSPGSGDVMPTRQRIGRHVFYCGVVGSMGVGFSDSCVLNLRGKSLQFQFDPLDGLNVNDETKQLEATMLKTLRIF